MNFWILLLVQNITVMRMQTCFIKRNKQFQPNNKDDKTNVPLMSCWGTLSGFIHLETISLTPGYFIFIKSGIN